MRKEIVSLLTIALFMGCITGGMVVNNGNKVLIEFTATVQNHTFDTGTISFIVGENSVLQGLEAGVISMKLGEEKTFTVPPSLAYGKYDESQVISFDRESFRNPEPELYDEVKANNKDGRIISISDESVIVDFNHPLAGHDIIFNVKIMTIEKI